MPKQNIAVAAMIACMLQSAPVQAQEQFGRSPDKKTAAIRGLDNGEGGTHSVEDAMEASGLQGLTVAVFENYEIAWTETWGVKDSASQEAVDAETAFSSASISKAITATLLAILEEKGMIDLKAPVASYLKRWKLPELPGSELNTIKSSEITFEHFLSHTAGTSQHGFDDFYEGDDIPTLVQSLNGEIPSNDAIKFIFPPGSHWAYSGGGYVIVQMAVEDYLGTTLADLAREHLFSPLGLDNTTMKQPNEDGFLSNVAKAHDYEGNILRTGIPITPQVAPSGMWTTAADMAVFLIDMQNALRGSKTKVISPRVARRVTDIVTVKVMGGYSLGWERREAFGNLEWFSHGGANNGTGGHIYATIEGGNGMVFFANGPNGVRFPVMGPLRDSILKTHEWSIPLDTTRRMPITQDIVDGVKGNYTHVDFGFVVTVSNEDGKLYVTYIGGRDKSELIHIGDGSFLIDEFLHTLKFEVNPADNLGYIARIRNGTNNLINYTFRRSTTREILVDRADSAYGNQQWAEASAAYDELRTLGPLNGQRNFQFGLALLFQQVELQSAIDAFQAAFDLGYAPPTTAYNCACAAALLGRTDEAIRWLQTALDRGFDNRSAFDDADLESIRDDPRFQAMIKGDEPDPL